MLRALKAHHQEVSCNNTGIHSPTNKTVSTAVHPHTDDSPYIIHVDVHYTRILVLLQLTSWCWAFKARNV